MAAGEYRLSLDFNNCNAKGEQLLHWEVTPLSGHAVKAKNTSATAVPASASTSPYTSPSKSMSKVEDMDSKLSQSSIAIKDPRDGASDWPINDLYVKVN